MKTNSANSPAQSVTPRGLGLWKILAWAGLLLAGALYMVDPVELFASPVAPICFVAADKPDSLVEIRVNGASGARHRCPTGDPRVRSRRSGGEAVCLE